MAFESREQPSADCGFRDFKMQQGRGDDPSRISLIKIMQSIARRIARHFFIVWRKSHKPSTLSAATPNANARTPRLIWNYFLFSGGIGPRVTPPERGRGLCSTMQEGDGPEIESQKSLC
jgi:hypothetical protein